MIAGWQEVVAGGRLAVGDGQVAEAVVFGWTESLVAGLAVVWWQGRGWSLAVRCGSGDSFVLRAGGGSWGLYGQWWFAGRRIRGWWSLAVGRRR